MESLKQAFRGYWGWRWWIKWPVTVLVGLIVIGIAFGENTEDDDAPPAAAAVGTETATPLPATTTVEPTPAATEVATEVPTAEPTPEPTLEPTAEPPAFSEPIELSGSGDDVVTFIVPENSPAIVELEYTGTGNFIVVGYGPGGERTGSLVNEIGSYSGVRPLNFSARDIATEFEVRASGPWTITILPLSEARVADPVVAGSGDDILIVHQVARSTLQATHSGQSNFIVRAWGETSRAVINEIGAYDGRIRLPDNTLLIEVQADGEWTFVFE